MSYTLNYESVINGKRCNHWNTKIEKKDIKGLFNRLRQRFGRCTGKVYCDSKDNKTYHVGWGFLRTVKNNDGALNSCETWVSIYANEDHKYIDPKTGEPY